MFGWNMTRSVPCLRGVVASVVLEGAVFALDFTGGGLAIMAENNVFVAAYCVLFDMCFRVPVWRGRLRSGDEKDVFG